MARKKASNDGDQKTAAHHVNASDVKVDVGLTPGAEPLKDERDEEFCQRYCCKGEKPIDVYHSLWKTTPTHMIHSMTERKIEKCRDRIRFLMGVEDEKRWTTWTKEESTKELKQIVKDPETTNAVRIKAINELNTMYQHNNPHGTNVTLQNKGIIFMARDGITLSNDFLRQAKAAIAEENQRYIDVKAEVKKDGQS